ncbi:MAG: hypothetical protein HY884_06905 [Deltaproteobacteria bacterium]|nr:hypothetical protein [Deltaproteobacteria bacterium]
MSGAETIRAITENLKTAFCSTGITFSECFADAKNVPASRLPCGSVTYNGESFEDTIGARPPYAEAEFIVRVFLKAGGIGDNASALQGWAHGIREAMTVEALNGNALADTKPVSRVTITRVEAETDVMVSVLKFTVRIRYREGV